MYLHTNVPRDSVRKGISVGLSVNIHENTDPKDDFKPRKGYPMDWLSCGDHTLTATVDLGQEQVFYSSTADFKQRKIQAAVFIGVDYMAVLILNPKSDATYSPLLSLVRNGGHRADDLGASTGAPSSTMAATSVAVGRTTRSTRCRSRPDPGAASRRTCPLNGRYARRTVQKPLRGRRHRPSSVIWPAGRSKRRTNAPPYGLAGDPSGTRTARRAIVEARRRWVTHVGQVTLDRRSRSGTPNPLSMPPPGTACNAPGPCQGPVKVKGLSSAPMVAQTLSCCVWAV
jgi:hypothetical protein